VKVIQTLLTIALLLESTLFAIEPETKIISQPGAPLKIISYEPEIIESDTIDLLISPEYWKNEGTYHKVKYQNISNKHIIAIQVCFVTFNIFNEFSDKRTGIATMDTIAPGSFDCGSWENNKYQDFYFDLSYIYVNKVRFIDGTFWYADLNAIVEELKKIDKEFDISNLKNKPK